LLLPDVKQEKVKTKKKTALPKIQVLKIENKEPGSCYNASIPAASTSLRAAVLYAYFVYQVVLLEHL